MAYHGFGVWALVAQQVVNLFIDTLILWLTVKWRPHLLFSVKRLRGLYRYGWKLLVSALIETVYNDVRQLIIGKLYSSSELAYYNQGKRIPNLVVANINASIDSVLLPAMSSVQEKKEYIRNMTRRSIKMSIYIMAPLMMGLCFCSTPLVRLVLTDKWLPCVPFLRIFCITYMFYPVHTANLNAIKAMGRSDLFLKLEICKKIIGITLLLFSMRFGVMAIAYSLLLGSLCGQIINSWPNKKLLSYSYIEQLKDIVPVILMAVFMGVCVAPIGQLQLPIICVLIIQLMFGVFIYIMGSVLLKIDSFYYLLYVFNSYFNRRRK